MPKDVRGCSFESSKNSMIRNSCKRVYSRILECRMRSIQPGNGFELLQHSHFLEGAIKGSNHRRLQFSNRERNEYRNYPLHPPTGPLPLDRLLINRGYRLRLTRFLYHHWLRARSQYKLLEAGGAREPIRADLSARVYSSGHRSS